MVEESQTAIELEDKLSNDTSEAQDKLSNDTSEAQDKLSNDECSDDDDEYGEECPIMCAICDSEIDLNMPPHKIDARTLPTCDCILHLSCIMDNLPIMDKCPNCNESTNPSEFYILHKMEKNGTL